MIIKLEELARDVKTMMLLNADADEVEAFIKNWKPATEDTTEKIDDWKPTSTTCPKCNASGAMVRVVESSDGAYEDYNYRCWKCNHDWWIDGIDS